jgi:hypothetical protein
MRLPSASVPADLDRVLTSESIFSKTYSVATQLDGTLDVCIDFTVRLERPDGQVTWEPVDPSGFHKTLARLGTEIKRPCAEQFTGQPVLAVCTMANKQVGQELQLVERYYNFSSVGSDDGYMKECLRLGGEWAALPQDSIEFRKARRSATLRALHSLGSGSG